MKTTRTLLILLAASLLVGPVFAGEGHHEKCTYSTQDCLDGMVAKLKERAWVGIEMEKGDDGSLVLTKVVAESPAQRAGMKSGDVLLAWNGLEFNEANEKEIWKGHQSRKPGESVTYRVRRAGGGGGA